MSVDFLGKLLEEEINLIGKLSLSKRRGLISICSKTYDKKIFVGGEVRKAIVGKGYFQSIKIRQTKCRKIPLTKLIVE